MIHRTRFGRMAWANASLVVSSDAMCAALAVPDTDSSGCIGFMGFPHRCCACIRPVLAILFRPLLLTDNAHAITFVESRPRVPPQVVLCYFHGTSVVRGAGRWALEPYRRRLVLFTMLCHYGEGAM